MKDPYEVRTITEGDLAKVLNKTTYFGEWKTSTPDAVVRDWFNVTIETSYHDNCNKQLCITNTGLVFESSTIGMELGLSTTNVVGSYIVSNAKWTFLEIGFINVFTRIIIDISMSKGGTAGERYQKINSAIRHSIVINSPNMLCNILETRWDLVTLLFFVELNKGKNPDDLDLDFYRKGFSIEPEMIDYIIAFDYSKLLKKAQKDNSTEIIAILLRWKKDYDSKKEAGGNKDGEIGL